MSNVSVTSSRRLLDRGIALLRQGRSYDAWLEFHEVARRTPSNALAHHMIGAMDIQAGQIETGVESLKRSIALDPTDPIAFSNLGNGLRALGRADEALDAYAASLALSPRSSETLNNRATLLSHLGRNDEALADYDRAMAIAPGHALLHGNRASVLAALGRSDDAIVGYVQAIQLAPQTPDYHCHLAKLLAEAQRHHEALAMFNRAILLNAEYAEAYMGRGVLLCDFGHNTDALADFDRAIALDPNSGRAHSNRADTLRRLNRLDEALEDAKRATELLPDDGSMLNNLANTLFSLDRHDEAIDAYDRALQDDPSHFSIWNDCGLSLHTLMRLDEAQASFDRALELRPDRAAVRFNRAMLLLLRGNFEAGWRDYDARKAIPLLGGKPGPGHGRPEWNGREPLAGRTLLLVSEQGLGDSLQFCRYADALADRGARVVIEVEKPLVRLLSTLRGVDQVVETGATPPDFDAWALMMSLPLAMKTFTPDSIPGAPYLKADPAQTAAFAARMGPRTRPRVGLVWSGGFRPDRPDLFKLNARRNIPLRLLAPVAKTDAEFYSLQRGTEAETEWAELVASGWDGPAMIDWTAELNDFADTAALIANLDLVIAVDTSTAHVAGALGKPVWILNRFDTCWRWLTDRTDSPWYPTARLFRQKAFGEWGPVVDEITEALRVLP